MRVTEESGRCACDSQTNSHFADDCLMKCLLSASKNGIWTAIWYVWNKKGSNYQEERRASWDVLGWKSEVQRRCWRSGIKKYRANQQWRVLMGIEEYHTWSRCAKQPVGSEKQSWWVVIQGVELTWELRNVNYSKVVLRREVKKWKMIYLNNNPDSEVLIGMNLTLSLWSSYKMGAYRVQNELEKHYSR